VPKDFKSLLPPKFIRLLEQKLETGEMTGEECKEIIKEMMLREYEREQAEKPQISKALASRLKVHFHSFLKKLWHRPLAQPTIGMEELNGTMRSRHF